MALKASLMPPMCPAHAAAALPGQTAPAGCGYSGDSAERCRQRLLNDLWRYDPDNGMWRWMGGLDTDSQSGVYGTKGELLSAICRHPGTEYDLDRQGR